MCFLCISSPASVQLLLGTRTHFAAVLSLRIPSAMATWGALSPQLAEDESDGDGDDGDVDAFNRSSRFSTPQETIMEEDEEENHEDGDQSRRFDFTDSADVSVALQELKSIRSHLYSAAEYCESAYLYSDQKQAIFENLRDYSVKALVNAVDHVGTVAAKMDELLLKRLKEMSVLELNTSRLTQQLQAYHDNAICEGLTHYQYARRRRRYGMRYTLSETAPDVGGRGKQVDKDWTIVQNTCQTRSLEQRKNDRASDTSAPRTAVWYMTAETPLDSSGRSAPTTSYIMNRSNSSNARNDNKFQGFLSRSLSGGRVSSPRSSPSPTTLDTIQEPAQFLGSSRKLSSLLSLDETKHHETHKKGLLSAFLGKAKSVKSKRLSTLTSFK